MSRASSLVSVVARALADEPEDVHVVETEHRGTLVVELYMPPGNLGHVIGRQGRTASAIRALAGIAGEQDRQQVQVEFRDGPAPSRS
ncbi:MAG: KH domain-containing protein [Vicinamibacterales bacterium]